MYLFIVRFKKHIELQPSNGCVSLLKKHVFSNAKTVEKNTVLYSEHQIVSGPCQNQLQLQSPPKYQRGLWAVI